MKCQFWLVIGALIVLGSCKKDPEIVLKGTVTEFFSGESLKDVEVLISYSQINYGSVSGGYELLAQTTTDASGHYQLNFIEPTTTQYRVQARRAGVISSVEVLESADLSVDETHVVDFELYLDAGLELSFVKENQNSTQALFQLDRHSEGCLSCCFSQQSYLIGGDTSFACDVYGNQSISYTLTVLNGESSSTSNGTIEVEDGLVTKTIRF